MVLIWLNYFSPALLFAPGSERTVDDVRVGDTTLAALTALPPEVASEVLLAMPAPATGWEDLGDFLLSREVWHRPFEPRLIVGVSRPSPFDRDARLVLYGDNSIELVEGDRWLAEENRRRAALELAPLPAPPE